MKSIILARVSTEEQMVEGQSIPAQLARARDYSNKKNLPIKSEHQFDESSIKDKRNKFEKVIEEIKNSKEPIALIVETVDRLQRSFKESVLLDELLKQGKVELHFIRENLVIHKDSNSSEIQRWDLAVFVAKSFVLQISDNVKRTNELKLKKGEWPGKATIGYINVVDDKGNKDIVLDPERKHFIIKIFETYASGNSSLNAITAEMKRLGLTSNTKNPKPLRQSRIHCILKDTFYYGVMKRKGQLLPHKYHPLITKELFDKVQAVFAGYHKKPFKYASKPFSLRGLILCADPECNCSISPETHKGHSYYSCTNSKKVHKKRVYVREEDLMANVHIALKNLQLTDKGINFLVSELRKTNDAKNEFSRQAVESLRAEHDKIEIRLNNMLDARFDGSITTETYDKKLKEYKERQHELIYEMQKYDIADENYYITVNTVLNVAQRASEIFESSEADEKRQLLNFLLQNLKLKEKTLQFELKKPFNYIVNLHELEIHGKEKTPAFDADVPSWLGRQGSNLRQSD